MASWKGTRRHHHDVRHIQASLHNSSMRRGGPIAINRHDRFSRRTWRNPSAAAAATRAAPPFRNRIANEPEATLLHHKHALYPRASCGFFGNLFMIPITEWRPASRYSLH